MKAKKSMTLIVLKIRHLETCYQIGGIQQNKVYIYSSGHVNTSFNSLINGQ